MNNSLFTKSGIVTILLTIVVTVIATSFCASSADSDPLVSLSYINDVVIPNIKAYIDEKIEALSTITSTSSNAAINVDEYVPQEDNGYEILALVRGQSVYALDTLEIIVRSGDAFVISPFPSQGIGNMVSGEELLNGDSVKKNNYCIIPRGDGRGVSVQSEQCYIMVRGEFEIR